MGGLYSKKIGIKSDKQRYSIREMVRTCKNFLCSDYVNKEREKKRLKLIYEEELLNRKEREKKKEKNKTKIENVDFTKTCCRILPGSKKCEYYCIQGRDYCYSCCQYT